MNALSFALSPEVLQGSLLQASCDQLLAWALAYAEPKHVYHAFGLRCAVELFYRDQFKRDEAAANALEKMGQKIRRGYHVDQT